MQVHGGNGACFQASLTEVTPRWRPYEGGGQVLVGIRARGQ